MTNTIINSITKNRKRDETIYQMTKKALNHDIKDFHCHELAGGLCNTVYLIEADSLKLCLKIASPENVVTMRHEKYYVQTEAEMLQLFGEKLHIPAPECIAFQNGDELCAEPYFFMSFIEGTPFNLLPELPPAEKINQIKFRVGEICRQISSLTAPCFGIPNIPETYTDNNYDFIKKLFEMLLQDAEDKEVEIPYRSGKNLLQLIAECRPALDEAKQPVHVHTDTWEGNLMVQQNELTGLIDYAAILYGDVLLNHDFHDFNEHPGEAFCKGFGKTSFSDSECCRILIYRIWHRLGIIVERGFREYEDPGTFAWVLDEYRKEVQNLEKLF